jgi:pSer/pThr/pTyr-binding forkhead associated (FHA) protein
MSLYDKPDPASRTTLDPRLAPIRLREGLVPEDAGIYLRIEEGPGAGAAFELSAGGVYLIGRDGADITLEDTKVSRKHAELGLYGPGAYVLRDLASTNGTYLNGRRVAEKHPLESGDRIAVGDTVMQFTLIEHALPVSR